MPPTWAFLDGPAPFAFAHRGGGDGVEENTMAAFARAVDLGYRYVETDVHRTVDGVLVAFHDDRLDRVTDKRGLISELTWDEVAQARIASTEPIPRFEELLSAWPDLRINVDPKSDAAVVPLIDVITRAKAVERICIGSFSDERIAHCRRQLGPELCTSPGPRGILRIFLRSFSIPVPVPPVGCVQVPETWRRRRLVTPRFVERCHALGLQVHVWTVNDAAAMTGLFDMGVDAVMTDEVELLRSVLEERGAWPAESG